jgi:hypothetical protein
MAAPDPRTGLREKTASHTRIAEITPANTDLPFRAYEIYVSGNGGELQVLTITGDDVTFTVEAKSRWFIQADQIKTGTTATGIVIMG